MITKIHTNLHRIKKNRKLVEGGGYMGEVHNIVSVRTYKGVEYGNHCEVDGTVKLVASFSKPLSCGAKVWLETQDEVAVYEVLQPQQWELNLFDTVITVDMWRPACPFHITRAGGHEDCVQAGIIKGPVLVAQALDGRNLSIYCNYSDLVLPQG